MALEHESIARRVVSTTEPALLRTTGSPDVWSLSGHATAYDERGVIVAAVSARTATIGDPWAPEVEAKLRRSLSLAVTAMAGWESRTDVEVEPIRVPELAAPKGKRRKRGSS